jgi:hypothetical protein
VVYAAIYVSRATRPFSPADLAELLFVSRRRNAERGLTGRLVYAAADGRPGLFAQWLEGEDWRVRELLYGSVLRDGRHALVGRPFEGPTKRRMYPDWTMGFDELDDEATLSEEVEALVRKAYSILPPKRKAADLAATIRALSST